MRDEGAHLQPLEHNFSILRCERVHCRRLNSEGRAEDVEEAGDKSSPKGDDNSVLDVVGEVVGEGEEVGVEVDGEWDESTSVRRECRPISSNVLTRNETKKTTTHSISMSVSRS